jgi:hypothetical protein
MHYLHPWLLLLARVLRQLWWWRFRVRCALAHLVVAVLADALPASLHAPAWTSKTVEVAVPVIVGDGAMLGLMAAGGMALHAGGGVPVHRYRRHSGASGCRLALPLRGYARGSRARQRGVS